MSTTCVAGTRTGSIGERLEPPPAFVNAYESSKWCAEQLLARSELPTRIVRLSTCLGDAATGSVHRFGAIHHVMKWMTQGLLPMLPAAEGSRFDVIATDVAARWIARALTRSLNGVEVCHVAAGAHAVPVRDLLDCTVTSLRELIPAWKNHQIEPPALVDAATFARFERTVTQSGDRLFRQVLASASAFLPRRLYPRFSKRRRASACGVDRYRCPTGGPPFMSARLRSRWRVAPSSGERVRACLICSCRRTVRRLPRRCSTSSTARS